MRAFVNRNARSVEEAVALAREATLAGRSVAFAGGGSDLLQLMKDHIPSRAEAGEPDVLVNLKGIAWLDRIESQGLQVSLFDSPVYGEERDAFIRQAKAVVNMHFYESSRFEQMRVSHCLSLGTPVIAERSPATRAHQAFADSVCWLDEAGVERFFASEFKSPAFYRRARQSIEHFRGFDPVEAYADALAFAAGFGRAHHERRPQTPWQPTRIHLGSGKDYRSGWLNLDVIARAEPDLVLTATESSDGYTGTVPEQLAELLGLPSVTFAKHVAVDNGALKVNRQTEDGYDEVTCPLPAVISVTAGVVEPRYPSFKGIMAAKSKPVETVTAADLGVTPVGWAGAGQTISSVTKAEARAAGEIIEDDGEGYAKIVAFLENLKVI